MDLGVQRWLRTLSVLSAISSLALGQESSGCGGALQGSGTIKSPHHPNHYPNNAACTWTVTAARPGDAIVIRVVDFSLESNYDWLRVYNGTKASAAPLYASWTANYYAGTKAILGNVVTLVFTSDGDGTDKGFQVEFFSADRTPYRSCGGTLQDQATLQSPLHPNAYPNNSLCTWTLRASAGSSLVIRLVYFDTESGYDSLVVYNSTDSALGPAVRYYSGSFYGSMTRVALGGVATLVFSSDATVTAKGFKIEFKSINSTQYQSCGGELSASGTLLSPNYPRDYPNNSFCTWTLTASPRRSVMMRLLDFNTESGYDQLSVYNGSSAATAPLVYSYSGYYYGSSTRAVLGSVATLVFKSDSEQTSTGFSIEFSSVDTTPFTACGGNVSSQGTLQSPLYPRPYPSNSRCTWRLRASAGGAVQLRFTELNIEGGPDTLMVYNSTQDSLGNLVYYYSGNYYVSGTGMRAVLGEFATVVFSSDPVASLNSGFSIEFTSASKNAFTGCGGEVGGSGTFSSPDYPRNYPNNSICTWKLIASPGKAVQIRLVDFNTESGYDYVKVYNGTVGAQSYPSFSYSGRYYGSGTRAVVGQMATVVFTSDPDVSASGFLIEFTSVDTTPYTDCGGLLVGHGVLQSPNFPNLYPNNSQCKWILKASAGKQVLLVFSSINVEGGYDFVRVYNSTERDIGPLTYQYSGNYYGSGSRAQLRETATVLFSSDAAVSAAGFRIEFSSVDTTPYTGCGGNLLGSGRLTSPNYPAQYPNNSRCTWTLTASPGCVVQVRLIDFSTESGNDALRLFNGSDASTAPQLYSFSGGYYGSGTRAVLGPVATAVFATDAVVTSTGFLAEFASLDKRPYTACGGPLSGSGVFSSPLYPNAYPNNSQCTWTLTASPGGAVQLRLVSFNLESGNDWVKVFNSTATSTGPLAYQYTGSYYGSGTKAVLGAFATVVFTSDVAVSAPGFQIEFTTLSAATYTGCGGDLTGFGTLSSPNYPLQYPNNSACTWRLRASPGLYAHVRVVDFSSESQYDWLRVYNGSQTTSPSRSYSGTYYYYYGGDQRVTVGTTATVVFSSDGDTASTGFLALFTSVDLTPYTACGGTLKDYGVIYSPLYPRSYPANCKCSWTLLASAGKIAQLRVTSLSLESGIDWVRVYNSTASAVGPLAYSYTGNYYGSATRAVLGPVATMTFTSDEVVSAGGFAIEFSSVDKSVYTDCGGELSGSGTLFSPNYPRPYPNNSACAWTLTASAGKFVQIRLVDFNVESGYDYVRVYNGSSTAAQSQLYTFTGTYYGSQTYAVRGSAVVTLVFTSDEDVPSSGFIVLFTSI